MTEWHEDIGRWEEAPDIGNIEWQGSFEPVPSPGWWASDSRLLSGRNTELGDVVLKQISRHAWSWRNRHNLIAASAAAGEAGIGPKVFASDAEREWWGGSWAKRATESSYAAHAIESGHSNPDELRRISQAWLDWVADRDGWMLMPHGEILARK